MITPNSGENIWMRLCGQAQARPEAAAVRHLGITLTYRQLQVRAHQLAVWLNKAGVEASDVVAVDMAKTPDLIATLLGIMATGASYLPLHGSHPEHLKAKLLRKADCTLILVDQPACPFVDCNVVTLQIPAAAPADEPECVARPARGDRALVMYTSGSTGSPKGVELRHHDVLALVDDPTWDNDRQRRVLSIAPYAFGLSSYEFWITLLRGNTVVLSENRPLDLDYLSDVIETEEVTAVHLTAGLMRLVADESPHLVRPLREVLTGGDVVPADSLRRIRAAAPDTWIRVLYGQTETTLFATQYQIAPTDPLPEGRVPIGTPLHGVFARLQAADKTEPSELWIGGAGVALGYIDDPTQTIKRFHSGSDGIRYFKTGDLCTQGEDGNLYFHGREDGMVKVRGHRVELAEVEGALTRVVGVREAVVLATAGGADDRAVHAFVVASSGFEPKVAKRTLATDLPDYAVPSRITVLDQLPINHNGKIDRHQLQLI